MPYFPPPATATGAAGGDLSGTFPNPTIGQISGDLTHAGTKAGFFSTAPIARPTAYTLTYAVATRTHAAAALSTNVAVALLTDVPAQFNATNAAVNEVKQLVNSIIDDLKAFGLLQ